MAEMLETHVEEDSLTNPESVLSPFGTAGNANPILLSALEHTADSVMICVTGGQILYVNPAFEKLTGYQRDEIVGQPASVLRGGMMPLSFYDDMYSALAEGRVFRGTFQSRARDGSVFFEDKTIAPMRDEAGRITHYVATARDASGAQKSFEMEMRLQAAEEAEQLKTNLLGTVSHELRTPLAAILSYTTAILDYGDALGKEKVNEYLHHIEDRSRQLERLISDLLTMSRLDSGSLSIELEDASLRDEILELVSEWRLRGTLNLEVSLPDDALRVWTDVVRIREVLQNLLENAERYAGQHSAVVIEAVDVGQGEVEVTVRDDGPGVAENELGAIFGRFYRAKSKYFVPGGAGIGLAICAGIVEAQGGKIRAYTPSSGGLAVAFTIPSSPKS